MRKIVEQIISSSENENVVFNVLGKPWVGSPGSSPKHLDLAVPLTGAGAWSGPPLTAPRCCLCQPHPPTAVLPAASPRSVGAQDKESASFPCRHGLKDMGLGEPWLTPPMSLPDSVLLKGQSQPACHLPWCLLSSHTF